MQIMRNESVLNKFFLQIKKKKYAEYRSHNNPNNFRFTCITKQNTYILVIRNQLVANEEYET